MTWDPVPYMIGGGAVHSEAVFRMLAYNALRGNEGVLGPNDLKVSELAVPGAGVQVGVGSAAMLARGAGQVSEMYAARMPTVDIVPIAATGAGAGRSDLIIGRVEDPNVASSPFDPPADVKLGPYVFTRVISGVPSTVRSVTELNLGYTACTLARVDIPASTSQVLQAMVVDLRRIANPRSDHRVYTVNPTTDTKLTSASLANWIGSWDVSIPLWATRAVIIATVGGVRHTQLNNSTAGLVQGQVRAALGGVFTQYAQYNYETSANNSTSRLTLNAADTVAIPANLRGTTQKLTIQGNKVAGNVPVSADGSTFASVEVEFQESAV